MDEGRCKDVEDARAGEDKDNGDRAQIEADGRRDASESKGTWGDAGGRLEEEGYEIVWSLKAITFLTADT